jgi:hypothetical protein
MLSGYYQVNDRWALMDNIGRNVTIGTAYEFIVLGKAGINQHRAGRFRRTSGRLRHQRGPYFRREPDLEVLKTHFQKKGELQ